VFIFDDQTESEFGGAGVLNGVVDSLLAGQIQAMARVATQRPIRQFGWKIQATAHSGGPSVIGGHSANVGDQALQRVMPGIDEPNYFVQAAGDFAGRGLDSHQMPVRSVCLLRFALAQLGKHYYPGEGRTKIIVDIARDAGAFAIQALLSLNEGQPLAHFSGRNPVSHGCRSRG